MVFSKDDLAVIKHYRELNYGAKRIANAVPNRGWKVRSVSKVLKKIDETGSANRKAGSGRPRTARTPETIAAVEQRILSQENQPGTHQTQRPIARALGISRRSVSRIARNDLHLTAFKKIKVHSLNAAQKRQRLQKCRALLLLPVSTIRKTVFTDEKNFPLTAPMNSQNDRVYGRGKKSNIAPERLQVEKDLHSLHVMVSAGVSFAGKTRLHFVEPGLKVTADYYCTLLQNSLIPDCRQLYPDGEFILQQDSAPVHTAGVVTELLNEENIQFWSRNVWPAKSPDLNPLDYRIWALLERKVYENVNRFPSIEALKAALVAAWDRIDLTTVRQVIIGHNGFCSRLEKVINGQGGHIESMMI